MEPGGESNIQQMLQQAQRMQEQLMTLQRELVETEIEGSAGGGSVTATVNGQSELIKLVIDPAAIDVTDPDETAETLADLVVAAIHNASEEAQRLQESKMGPLSEGLSNLSNLGGGGMGSLPGM